MGEGGALTRPLLTVEGELTTWLMMGAKLEVPCCYPVVVIWTPEAGTIFPTFTPYTILPADELEL